MGAQIRERKNKMWYSPRLVDIDGKKFAKFRYKDRNGEYGLADIIDGSLVEINFVEDTYEGKPANRWEFVLEDKEGQCIIQASVKSVFSQGLITRLAALPSIDYVEIGCYASNEGESYFCNPTMQTPDAHGALVKVRPLYKSKKGDEDSADQLYLPEVEKVTVSGEVVNDKTKRLEFLAQLVEQIRSKLSANPSNWRLDPDDAPIEAIDDAIEFARELPKEKFEDDLPF